jgi:ankyrin repeat protein
MKKITFAILLLIIPTFQNFSQEFKDLAQKVIDKDFEVIDTLLNAGMDINIQDKSSGVTVLMIASAYPHYYDMLEFLLKRNADVNLASNEGKTALIYAVSASPENVKLILSKGAKVNVKANDGMTPFFQSVVSVLSNKVTTEVCDILIKAGAEVNASLTSNSGSGWTALHFAAFEGNLEVVNYLIKHGANVNAVSDDGSSVLALAKSGNFDEVVTALRKSGARD